MFRFVSDALLSLVMDKKARNKLRNSPARRKVTAREVKINELQETVGRVMTPERQALILKAMKVQRAKSKILNDLKDEDKQKLYALAVKKLLREGEEAKN